MIKSQVIVFFTHTVDIFRGIWKWRNS